MVDNVSPSHVIQFTEQVNCFAICGTDFAPNLCCISAEKKLILGLVSFPEENENAEFVWERLKEIYNENRCHALCFAPNTSLAVIPKVVTFCSADAGFALRIFRTDLKNADTVQTLIGHSNYVNDIAWDAECECLASVSDDFSCKIWSSESNYDNIVTFCLSSAGMSVKWHPDEPHKLLVAEKKGIIHFYNVRSQQAITSIQCAKAPLMSVDWSLSNSNLVVASAVGEIFIWDLSRRHCTPLDVKQLHEDGGRCVRFSPNSERILASIGRPNNTIKVFTVNSLVSLLEVSLKLYSDIAWHHRLPYIAAAYDHKLCFWKVQYK